MALTSIGQTQSKSDDKSTLKTFANAMGIATSLGGLANQYQGIQTKNAGIAQSQQGELGNYMAQNQAAMISAPALNMPSQNLQPPPGSSMPITPFNSKIGGGY